MIVSKNNYCDLLKSPSWPPFSFSMGPVDTSVENTGKNTVVPFGIFYTWTLYYLALKLGPCYSCTEMFTFRTGVLKYMYLSIWPACYQLWYSIRIKIKTVNGDCLIFRLQKKETINNYGKLFTKDLWFLQLLPQHQPASMDNLYFRCCTRKSEIRDVYMRATSAYSCIH